jgi:hypothetical protein
MHVSKDSMWQKSEIFCKIFWELNKGLTKIQKPCQPLSNQRAERPGGRTCGWQLLARDSQVMARAGRQECSTMARTRWPRGGSCRAPSGGMRRAADNGLHVTAWRWQAYSCSHAAARQWLGRAPGVLRSDADEVPAASSSWPSSTPPCGHLLGNLVFCNLVSAHIWFVPTFMLPWFMTQYVSIRFGLVVHGGFDLVSI